MEKGAILCCKLKRPVPNGGEFQTLFVTQLDISADSKFRALFHTLVRRVEEEGAEEGDAGAVVEHC